MTDYLAMLEQGQIFQAIISLYQNVFFGYFVAIMILLTLTMIYFKTRNLSLTAIIGIILFSLAESYGYFPLPIVQYSVVLIAVVIAIAIVRFLSY